MFYNDKWCLSLSKWEQWVNLTKNLLKARINGRICLDRIQHFVRWIRIKELRERNRNGLIFLPFETLHQQVLMEGTFGPEGVYAQIIDHPSVTRLDKFILADVFISNEMNDHFTIGAVFIQSLWIITYWWFISFEKLDLKTNLSFFWWHRL